MENNINTKLDHKKKIRFIKKAIIAVLIIFTLGFFFGLDEKSDLFFYFIMIAGPFVIVFYPVYFVVFTIKYFKKDTYLDVFDGIIFFIIMLSLLLLLLSGLSRY